MNSPRFTYQGKQLLIKAERYADNGRLALLAMCRPEDWNEEFNKFVSKTNNETAKDSEFVERFAVLTVNIPEASEPPKNFAYFKNWSENEDLFEALKEQKIIGDMVSFFPTGFVAAPLCEILIPLK